MTSTQPSLPTGWLAPPPGLLPSNDPIKIEPIPIAITATLAFIVGAVVILLITRKDKDVFVEDRIVYAPETADAASPIAEIPMIQQPAPTFTNLAGRRPGFQQAPKATAMLGMGAHNWQHEVANREAYGDAHAQEHKEYYDAEYDSEDETLQDYEKGSAYWPAVNSDVYEKEIMGRFGDSSRPQSYQDGSVRRSSFGIASNTHPGDAY
jgi:hypothetical protein